MRGIESVIERMRQVLGVAKDTELAEILGMKSSGAISTWKKRGSVPLPQLVKVSQIAKCTVDWLLTGEESAQLPEQWDEKDVERISMSVDGLSAREARLVWMFRRLPEARRRQFESQMATAYIIEAEDL